VTEPSAIRENQTGDRQAFAALVDRHYRSVYRLAYHYAGNHQDAGDICQQTFLIALERIANLRDRDRFEGWVLVIASNLLRRRIRHAVRGRRWLRKGSRDVGRQADPAGAATSCDDAGRTERAQAVRTALQKMPEKMRLAAILVLMEGRPQKDVARILNCSPATMCRRVEGARDFLRADLRQFID
jgi:RNA polymerase sigma-70 factor (ECF subfamily)